MTPGEVQKIVVGMDDPSGLQAGGVYAGGIKYMFIRSDDRMVVGSKKVRGEDLLLLLWLLTRRDA